MPENIAIIIPTFNAVHHLKRCVQTLKSRTSYPYKLYIADDCSPQAAMHDYLEECEHYGRATVLRGRTRRGFGGINNWAATQVDKDAHLLLLNSDIEPLPGWLTPMVAELEHPKVGVVGARLLYPDTKERELRLTIQHAGVARTDLGYPYHIFRGELATYPPANKRRSINAVTAACTLIRRQLWDDLGGFDPQFVLGQFEDIDFCWRARKEGWRVIYQPLATLYHYEHGSGEEWVVKTSEINCRRLRAKWEWIKGDEYLFKDD
jgi:GT2 family glycosyltransferase